MKLQSIAVTGKDGLKGWTGTEKLSGVDVFAGANGVGKSTRLLAVLAGLRGLAQTPTDAVREFLGFDGLDSKGKPKPILPSGTVDLQFGDTRISRPLNAGPQTDAAKKANGAATAVAGPHLVRWDLSDFAASTKEDRQVLLSKVCDVAATDWTVKRLLAELQPGASLTDFGALADLSPTDPGAWLDAAIEWAAAAYAKRNADHDRLKSECTTLLEQQAEPEAVPADLQARINALLERRAKHKADVAAYAAAQKRIAGAKTREVEARRKLEVMPAPRTADLATFEKALATAKLGRPVAPVAPSEDVVRAAERTLAEASKPIDTGAVIAAKSGLVAAIAAREALPEITDVCRHCGEADPLGLGSRKDSAEAVVVAARGALAQAEADLVEPSRAWNERVEELRTELAEAREDLETAQLVHRKTAAKHADAERAWQAALDAAQSAVDAARSDLNRAALRKAAEEALAQAVADAAETSVEPGELEADDLDALRAQAERATRSNERSRLYEETLARRDEAETAFEGVKKLGASLKGLRVRVTAEAFAPIEREASALGFAVRFRSAADFGAEIDGRYTHWSSLSDGERAQVGAGLSYAFARLGKAPWRAVILDGAEAIDPVRLRDLLARLVERVGAGDLDNVLVGLRADLAPVDLGEGVTVHWLGVAADAARKAA